MSNIRLPYMSLDGDGGFVIHLGNVTLSFDKTLVDKINNLMDGGPVDLIPKTDILENKYVEVMDIDGVIYTKMVMRDIIKHCGNKCLD